MQYTIEDAYAEVMGVVIPNGAEGETRESVAARYEDNPEFKSRMEFVLRGIAASPTSKVAFTNSLANMFPSFMALLLTPYSEAIAVSLTGLMMLSFCAGSLYGRSELMAELSPTVDGK